MLPRVITCCAVLLDVTDSYYMLCSVVRCYQEILHALQCCCMLHRVGEFFAAMLFDVFLHDMQCCYMLHCIVEFCAAVLFVVMCSCIVQCCYILPSFITCCAVLLDVTESYYMLCSVVTYYRELLHAV